MANKLSKVEIDKLAELMSDITSSLDICDELVDAESNIFLKRTGYKQIKSEVKKPGVLAAFLDFLKDSLGEIPAKDVDSDMLIKLDYIKYCAQRTAV